jgi:hypothetical protein
LKAKVGAKALHHGRLHELVRFEDRPALDANKQPYPFRVAVLENDRYLVKCNAAELAWDEVGGVFYLPGRVLAKDERTLVAAMVGGWPKAGSHLAVRRMLDVEGPLINHLQEAAINSIHEGEKPAANAGLELLKGVVRARRLTRAEGETGEDFDARVEAYALAAIAHCEELRDYRKGAKADVAFAGKEASDG